VRTPARRSAPSVIVVDASAVVDLLLRRPSKGSWVAEHVLAAERVHSPAIIDLEVASAFRRFERRREIAALDAARALARLPDAVTVRHSPLDLLPRVWALRHALSAYDAAYVALAEALGIPLVTTDAKLGRARGHRAEVLRFRS